jgi:peroxiredoxin
MNLNDEIQQVLASYALPNDVIETFAAAMGRLDENKVAPGLSVGERAPDFELPDPNGKPVRLSDRLAKGPVVLSFFRGDWCPVCNLQLRALERALPEIREAPASLVAVTPQFLEHTLSLQEKAALSFDVLSDVAQKVIRDYRVQFTVPPELKDLYLGFYSLDLGEQNGDGSWNLPVPGTFIIDAEGVIRRTHVTADFTRRMEPDDVIEALQPLAAAAAS